jgi:hypothetical protein
VNSKSAVPARKRFVLLFLSLTLPLMLTIGFGLFFALADFEQE